MFFGAWPDDWKKFNITILEFYPIVLSALLFGGAMRNQRITFFTDNAALVDIINKATSRDATVMVFVRRLVLAWLNFNIFSGSACSPSQERFSRFFVSVTGFQVQAASSSGCTVHAYSHPIPLLPHDWQL